MNQDDKIFAVQYGSRWFGTVRCCPVHTNFWTLYIVLDFLQISTYSGWYSNRFWVWLLTASDRTGQHRTTAPAKYLWTSAIWRCWPDCLELFARGHVGSGGFWGQLQAVTEDVFIFAVLVCSAY